MAVALALVFVPLAYLLFVCVSLGLPERLRLAFGPLSLEKIADVAARKHGDRVLFTTDEPCAWTVPQLGPVDGDSWTARRIRATAGYVAGLLRERFDLQRDERVAILKRNHLDMHLLMLGIIRAGGMACPINGSFLAAHVEPYLRNVGARVLFSDAPTLFRVLGQGGALGDVQEVVLAARRRDITDGAFAALETAVHARHPGASVHCLEDLLGAVEREHDAVERAPGDPLYLVHSSGTTGFPKAVVLRNGKQAHAMRGWLCYVHVSRRRDKGYLAVPNNHQAVILSFNSLLLLGLTVHWTQAAGREGFDARRVVAELARGRFTGFFGFPILYTQLKEVALAEHDLTGMRFWASTADAAHEEVIKPFVAVGGTFRRLGLPFTGSIYLDAQGSSEVGTPSVLRYYTRLTKRYERRIGRRHSTPFGPEIRITRDGQPVTGDAVGRLEVRGRTVFDTYWNNPALTSEVIRDGWFFTGDVARFSRDGHLVQLDREVDVIRSAAGDVYSLLIEEIVHKHPGVYDACVYGARQADGTQAPAAAIALRRGADLDPARLRTELNAMLSPSMWLSQVDILPWEQFPVGVTGKTLKRVFREKTEPRPVTGPHRPVGRVPDSRPALAGPQKPPPIAT
jgi:acyl-CoA synthetase (AMP-forming)/AMP-acid ligase II